MGERVFNQVQYGKETVHGTAVAATKRWLGTIKVPPAFKPKYPADTLGVRGRANRSVINQVHLDGVTLAIEDGYFQALPMLMSIGLKGAVTAAEQTTGQHDYLWDFTPDLTDVNEPDSLTIEYGDDTQAYEMPYAMAKMLKLAGSVGEDAAVSLEAELFASGHDDVSFTASIARPVVEPMVANMAKWYMDGTWATLGTTQYAGLVRKYSVDIITGVHPKFWAEGTKKMTGHAEGAIEVMATFTFEGNSDAVAIWSAYEAQTKKAIRLEILGSQIGTGDPHSLVVDIYGTFEEVIPLGEEANGNNLYTAVFHGMVDDQSVPHMLGVKVTTDVNAI